MQSITEAIYKRMATDDVLKSLVASYRGKPAIFTADPVPGDAGLPLILSTGLVSGTTSVPEASKQTIAARVVRDITCITEARGSMVEITAIAMRVFWLFERSTYSIEGWRLVRSRANLPISGEADGQFNSLVVTVTMAILKE